MVRDQLAVGAGHVELPAQRARPADDDEQPRRRRAQAEHPGAPSHRGADHAVVGTARDGVVHDPVGAEGAAEPPWPCLPPPLSVVGATPRDGIVDQLGAVGHGTAVGVEDHRSISRADHAVRRTPSG